jgi:chemotaxis protein histidine kinase CheA
LIDTTTDSNKRLRSELAETRGKLARVQRDYDDLESDHSQCPYWIQRNESIARTLDDRCQKLEKEKERLQDMCDELTSEVRRLRAQNFDEVDNTDREEQDEIQ